jgi:uncharacterized protein YqgC (DUF456 family)
MVDLVTVAALALLAAGVAGCVVPAVPGPPLSLAGVYVGWWGSGYSEPGTVLLGALTLFGVLAIAADFAADVVSARIGGASLTTSVVAGVVGVLAIVLVGPVGSLLGVVATVFVLEYRRHADAVRGAKTAGVVVLGMLGSTAIQVLLTGSMLVAYAAAVLF